MMLRLRQQSKQTKQTMWQSLFSESAAIQSYFCDFISFIVIDSYDKTHVKSIRVTYLPCINVFLFPNDLQWAFIVLYAEYVCLIHLPSRLTEMMHHSIFVTFSKQMTIFMIHTEIRKYQN